MTIISAESFVKTKNRLLRNCHLHNRYFNLYFEIQLQSANHNSEISRPVEER